MEKRVDKSFYDNANIESTSESRINIAFLRTKKKHTTASYLVKQHRKIHNCNKMA